MLVHKTFEMKILERRKDGGRIIINTSGKDRDRDRVFPSGARVDNYNRNPVVQFGHNYKDPWATVGRTTMLEMGPDHITADFELRPAANEQDPQNIVRLLWEGEWIRTASIGFLPSIGKPNEFGGLDYTEWDLLEWSLVPIPSNQDALRLAVKGLFDEGLPEAPVQTAETSNLAWVRRLEVENELGHQDLFVVFYHQKMDIPPDNEILNVTPEGECEWVPDPDAGKSVVIKHAVFTPPLQFADDAAYSISQRVPTDETSDATDKTFLEDNSWTVKTLSEVIASIPYETTKGLEILSKMVGTEIPITQKLISRAKALSKNVARAERLKRGRVLSAANEQRIRDARDNLDMVLSQLDANEQPEEDASKTQTEPDNQQELIVALQNMTRLVGQRFGV